MTSNIGSEHLLDGVEDNNGEISAESRKLVMNELKSRFKPEFLNRVDDTIMFKPLSKVGIKKIIDIFLNELRIRLKDKDMDIEVTDRAKDLLADEGYDPIYGARPLKRYVQNTLENALARKIISGDFSSGQTVVVDSLNDQLTISHK